MTNERAKSELMQIYMSLSEEKKKAIDTLIKASQGTMLNCPSCGLEVHSDFSECPRCGEQLQTCGSCRNEGTYHCADCENKSDYEQAQADGEYIPKQAVLENIDKWYEDKADIEDLIVKITYMPSVAIPNKVGHWVETGRMFVELNDDQILYECICDKCKGLAYFRKSMDDLVGAKYCPCCNSPMEIER